MPATTTRVLITGGTGFIGSHLKDELAGSCTVLSPTHQELDLRDPVAVERYLGEQQPEAIVHCADHPPRPGETGAELLTINLQMYFALARHLGRGVRQLIHFGSGAEYDKSRPLVRIREEVFGERIPPGEYGLGKYLIGHWAEATAGALNLRLFGIFGPREHYLIKFISNAIVKNLLGLDIVIHQNVRFSYLWIGDLVTVVKHFLQHPPKHRSYNVVPDRTVDLAEIVACINAVANRPSKVTVLKRGLGREYTADDGRLRAELPDLRFTELRSAIAQLYAYYASRVDQLDAAAITRDEYLTRITRGSTMNL